jgi:hypothetical protein
MIGPARSLAGAKATHTNQGQIVTCGSGVEQAATADATGIRGRSCNAQGNRTKTVNHREQRDLKGHGFSRADG